MRQYLAEALGCISQDALGAGVGYKLESFLQYNRLCVSSRRNRRWITLICFCNDLDLSKTDDSQHKLADLQCRQVSAPENIQMNLSLSAP